MPGDRPVPGFHPLTAPVDALWHLAASPKTGAALIALAAVAMSVGLALPQAPWGAGATGPDYQRWLANLQVQHGAWVAWPARAGLLSLHSTPGFRLLWAALGFAALVATADVTLAWREQTARRGMPWRMLAHVGFLVVLLGFVVQAQWGWEQERLLLGSGAAVPVGPPAGGLYVQRADRPEVSPGSVAVLWRQGESRGEAELQAGRPLIVGLRSLHLLQAGPAVRLRLVDSAGQAALLDDPSLGGQLQPELTLRFRSAGESRYVSIPARDWVVRVAYQPAAPNGSPYALWVYRGLEAASLAQASFATDGELAIGEFHLRWQVLPYVELRAAFQPALGLWVAGWLLLCVGFARSVSQEAGQAGKARAAEGAGTRGQASWARWVWLAATLLVGCTIWLAAGGLMAVDSAPLLTTASRAVLALSAAVLLLGSAGGLLRRLGRQLAALEGWPRSLAWGLLGWTVAGGLMVLASWAADGTLWRWQPAQAWWALTWCVMAATRHLRGARRRRALLPGLALAACLATWTVLAGHLFGAPAL